MLKDVMEELGFFKNDAQVASEHIEKFFGQIFREYILRCGRLKENEYAIIYGSYSRQV